LEERKEANQGIEWKKFFCDLGRVKIDRKKLSGPGVKEAGEKGYPSDERREVPMHIDRKKGGES